MTRLLIALLAVMTLGAGPAAPAVPKSTSKALAPEVLSPLARELLRKRMDRHGESMVRLVVSVTLLQHEKSQRFASEIANEPRLMRPMPGEDDTFNNGLPERLFALQDELRSRAKTLAVAAAGVNDELMAANLGLLMQTCVSCHSLFLSAEIRAAP
jgi:hypothetical protein